MNGPPSRPGPGFRLDLRYATRPHTALASIYTAAPALQSRPDTRSRCTEEDPEAFLVNARFMGFAYDIHPGAVNHFFQQLGLLQWHGVPRPCRRLWEQLVRVHIVHELLQATHGAKQPLLDLRSGSALTGELCPCARFILAEILVLAGTAGAGGMEPPTSTRISTRTKRVGNTVHP